MTDQLADVLPLKPADAEPPPAASANAQPAHPRAREGKLWAGWLAQFQLLLAGASVIDAAPPALLVVWSRHSAAAKFYKHRAARWPCYAYGFAHTFLLTAPAYFLVWATDSRPKLLATALVIITLLWLFKVI